MAVPGLPVICGHPIGDQLRIRRIAARGFHICHNNDTVYAGLGHDVSYGGYGADLIYGSAGSNTIYTSKNQDSVVNGFADTVIGGSGNDTV